MHAELGGYGDPGGSYGGENPQSGYECPGVCGCECGPGVCGVAVRVHQCDKMRAATHT